MKSLLGFWDLDLKMNLSKKYCLRKEVKLGQENQLNRNLLSYFKTDFQKTSFRSIPLLKNEHWEISKLIAQFQENNPLHNR